MTSGDGSALVHVPANLAIATSKLVLGNIAADAVPSTGVGMICPTQHSTELTLGH